MNSSNPLSRALGKTRFPAAGGELGKLFREKDWSESPLGPTEDWPAALKNAVSLMLAAPAQIVMFWGADFVALYNDSYAPTIGNKHPQALGRPACECWAELWDDLEPLLLRVYRDGEVVVANDRPFQIARRGYLETVYFDIAYSPVRDEDGRVAGVFCIVSETTERVVSEQRLRESEAKFRTFAQAVPNHVWTSPANGKLDWFNDRVYAYSGAAEGSLDGSAWAVMVHPDDIRPAAATWAAALESGENYEAEFRLRNAAGEYRWHVARAVAIRDPQGAVVRWVGTNTDIEDQKQIAAELADLAATLEHRVEERTQERDRIWNNSSELMAVAGHDGYLKAFNPAWKRTLGWDDAALARTPFIEFIHEDDRADAANVVAHLARGEPIEHFEDRMRAADGSYRSIAWTAVPAGETFYAVGRDITQQRLTEDALRQSQKMEAVGQLTGGIAHDFNNLLQAILGSLDLVRKRTEQGRFGDAERFIGNAVTAANRAAALTHRLLAFSRRQPLDPKIVEANRLIGSIEELLRRTTGEAIALELALASDLWPTRCDPNQLESAIINLAINARDAMPEGGTIAIETGNVVFGEGHGPARQDFAPGEYVEIAVRDTGTGMTEEVLARAFEPFFTTKPAGQGTGLGLSMIYGFARQSGGEVRIESEPGRGTVVRLYLPRIEGRAQGEQARAGKEAKSGESSETVLVVEDESIVRTLVVDVLQELGYRTIEAADGPAAVRILESKPGIDLLITDMGLPGLNGRQVAEAARARDPELKILFITGYAENAAAAEGFLEPGMELMTKPFAMDALAAQVRRMRGA